MIRTLQFLPTYVCPYLLVELFAHTLFCFLVASYINEFMVRLNHNFGGKFEIPCQLSLSLLRLCCAQGIAAQDWHDRVLYPSSICTQGSLYALLLLLVSKYTRLVG